MEYLIVANLYLKIRLTLDIMGVQLKVAAYRHISIGFMWAWLKHFNPTRFHFENSSEEEEDDFDFEEVNDLYDSATGNRDDGLLYNQQASHSATTANRSYAFSNNDFSYLGRDNLHNYYLCSLEWHTLLGNTVFDTSL